MGVCRAVVVVVVVVVVAAVAVAAAVAFGAGAGIGRVADSNRAATDRVSRRHAAADAEIGHLEGAALGGNEQVGRLEVAMDDAHAVQCVDAAEQLPREEARVLLGERLLALDHLVQVRVQQVGDPVQVAPVCEGARRRPQHTSKPEEIGVLARRARLQVAHDRELPQAAAQLQHVLRGPNLLDRHLGAIHRVGR
eukprot:1806087-Prymnesium_polylepis.1